MMLSLGASPLLAGEAVRPRCLMQPAQLEMRLPSRGFLWLPGEDASGKCAPVPKTKWQRKSAGSLDLFVYADGPVGSGRFWTVTIGVGERQQPRPMRGVCLRTSTVGWRTYQYYKRTPLVWLEDLDNDGKAELIIWGSFPLHEDASLAEYGLVAWVFRLASPDSLVIDWPLSRRMAREVAEVYRSASDSAAAYPGHLAKAAADALELFVAERCLVPKDVP
jgi:hypothetical protein